MIGSGAIYQQILHRHELRTLASTNSLYDRAQSLVAQQLELKRQLQSAGYEAELFTYLRHPWPTTQLLNAALSPLPDRVTLHEIHLYSGDAARFRPRSQNPNRQKRRRIPCRRRNGISTGFARKTIADLAFWCSTVSRPIRPSCSVRADFEPKHLVCESRVDFARSRYGQSDRYRTFHGTSECSPRIRASQRSATDRRYAFLERIEVGDCNTYGFQQHGSRRYFEI